METPYENDIKACVEVMKHGGVVLYPTDTIWGLGCDATQADAVNRIIKIKKRAGSKSFVLLMTDVRQLSKYIADPLPDLETVLAAFTEPTTVIYQNAIDLPSSVMGADGSIAVRITKDPFCRSLIKRLRAPLVSTSANISGVAGAGNFAQIANEIKESADHVVQWRQHDDEIRSASVILMMDKDGAFVRIR